LVGEEAWGRESEEDEDDKSLYGRPSFFVEARDKHTDKDMG